LALAFPLRFPSGFEALGWGADAERCEDTWFTRAVAVAVVLRFEFSSSLPIFNINYETN
jgi:hypothetical protein